MLTTVTAFREPWEAHMFCGRLSAEGIPAFVAHEYHVGNAWYRSLALGGVKVQVPDDWAEDAHDVARLCANGEFEKLLEPQFGDLVDVRCPKCDCTAYRKRRSNFRAIAALTISFLSGFVFPPVGWVYICQRCGTKYMAPLYRRTVRDWLNIWAAIGCEMAVVIALFVFMWLLFEQHSFTAIILAVMAGGLWLRKRLSWLDNDPE